MKTQVQKWGNSLALRIPKIFAEAIGIASDSPIEITVEGNSLIITPLAEAEVTLDMLLAGITDENLHGEVDMGGPAGNEVW